MLLPHSFKSLKWVRFCPRTCVQVAAFAVIGSICVASAQNRFVQVPKYPAGGSLPNLLAQYDVDGDGNLDALVMNVNAGTKLETVSLLSGTGTGGYRAPRQLAYFPISYGPPLAADVNRDGYVDLIFYVSSTHLTRVYLGRQGAFQSIAIVSEAGVCTSIDVCPPPEMHVADLNGDGNPDLMMGFDSGFYVSLGNGNGSFRSPMALNDSALAYTTVEGGSGSPMAVNSSANSYTTGDFNNDGLLDLAFTGSAWFQVLWGNGDGTFRNGPRIDSLEGRLLSADLRGSGETDLIVLREAYGIAILLGNGDGTFITSYYPTGQGTENGVVADMNGDGRPDIVVGNRWGASYSVLLNAGSGKFSPAVNYRAPEPIAGNFVVGDLNGDRKPDVTISAQGGVEVFRNIGGGRLRAPVSLDLEQSAEPFATYASDLNHDGIPDLATFINFSEIFGYRFGAGDVFLSHNGQPFVSSGSFGFPGSYPLSFGLGDFNGDGNIDIIADSAPRNGPAVAQVQFNNGKGQFPNTGPIIAPGDGDYVWVAVGDFNRDGFGDIVLGNGLGLLIGLGNGKGDFVSGNLYSGEIGPVLVRDISGDGKLDLINLNQSGTLDILLGNGDGTFLMPKKYSTAYVPKFVATGDLNRDSKIDVIVAGESEVSVLLNNGNGTFAPAVNYPAGGPVSAMAQISLFGNGNEGVLVADGKDDKLFLLAGDGKGHLAAAVNYYPGGGNPQGLSVADFNRDGAPDVAVTDWTTNSFMVLYNTGGTMIKLASTATQPVRGQTVKLTATVTPSVGGSGTPTGTVAFKEGSTTLGSVNLSGGTATFSTAMLSPGTHIIKASYYGSTNFNPHLSAGITVSVR